MGLLDSLFGNSGTTQTISSGSGTEASVGKANTTGTKKGTETKGFDVSEDAVNKIVADVLAGTGGLADIFGQQAGAGVYSATAAKQATGDLVSKIVGEVAKLNAKETTTYDIKEETAATEEGNKTATENITGREKTKGGILGFFS